MRLVGAALVLAGPAMVGFRSARRLARRPECLRTLHAALEQMAREISFRLTPLPELFRSLAETYEGPVGLLFASCVREMEGLGTKSMAQIWRQALTEVPLDLEGRAARALEALGEVLGRYDGENLRGALEQACGELAAAAEEAEREWERKGRMEQVLGLTAGGLLVILLM